MKLKISSGVRQKLARKQPPVTEEEIVQCFCNRGDGKMLLDDRENNQTTPPTHWFISETNFGRKLKICFILTTDEGVVIKTAYAPNQEELRIYKKYGVGE